MAPDLVLATKERRLILDAKYKDTEPRAVAEEDADLDVARTRMRIGRGDIYQAISYGQHLRLSPATVGLVFPVVLRLGETLPPPLRVIGFAEDVFVVFLDVGPFGRGNLAEFYDVLRLLVDSPEASAVTEVAVA